MALNVTKTYLPPLKDYSAYLEKIWENGWITNNGNMISKLENKLKSFLGLKHLFLVSNGTLALQIAINALSLKGEIITTPFSYVATTSSIVWEGCKPIFVDIEADTLTIDANKIEKAINKNTVGIVATHIYGNPCDVKKINKIAKRYKLNVIYDGAHSFGVKYLGKSIYNNGDISMLSFHATKLFHTAEGGALACDNDEIAHRISYMRNSGHKGEDDFWGIGINGKMSELHAAMGLSILPQVNRIIRKRKKITSLYNRYLFKNNSKLSKPVIRNGTDYNFSYYPVIFNSNEMVISIKNKLNQMNIFPRRYFYPSLNTLNYVPKSKMPIAEDISNRILCLPLYHDLNDSDVIYICNTIKENI